MWFNFELHIPFDCWSLRSCVIFLLVVSIWAIEFVLNRKLNKETLDTNVTFLWTVDNGPTLGEASYEQIKMSATSSFAGCYGRSPNRTR